MSTIWDRAVRALHPVFEETSNGFGTVEPLSYYCGGPEMRCTHRTCAAVSALAEEDLLNYATLPTPATPVQCPEVYDGENWEPSRCREVANHQTLPHVDRYLSTGEAPHVEYLDLHQPHMHHTDQYGRTWGAES